MAEPADLVLLSYVTVTGALVAVWGWRLESALWLGLTMTHVALAGLTVAVARIRRRGRSLTGLLRDIYPLLLIPVLYWEIRHLARLFGSDFHDGLIQRLEEAVFGEQLAITFSQRWPELWLSELMHFFYGVYWLLLPIAVTFLYARRRLRGLRELVFVTLVLFFVCYLAFIFFPVAGPHYQFPNIGEPLADGPLYRFVHWVLADGGSQGAAFPSSHVAVAVGIVIVAWRHDRALFTLMTPLVAGLIVGTIYGRFHYGIDAAAGVAVAILGVPFALDLRRRIVGGREEPSDGQATPYRSRSSNR